MRTFRIKADPVRVNAYTIINAQSGLKIPRPVWDAMLGTANNVQQKAHREILNFMQTNWASFQH